MGTKTIRAAIAAICVAAALPSWAADWTDANGNTYTALEYIKGTAGPCVITDFKLAGTDTVKFRFQPTSVFVRLREHFLFAWREECQFNYLFPQLQETGRGQADEENDRRCI